MANQTELLNVSDEMKLDDERQSFEGLECGEGLCSSSSDTTEELYSSSAPDTCRDCSLAFQGNGRLILFPGARMQRRPSTMRWFLKRLPRWHIEPS